MEDKAKVEHYSQSLVLKFLCQQKLVPKFIIKDIGLIVSIVCQSNWDINGEQEK